MKMVTGPSLTRETCISAPNSPLSTLPSSKDASSLLNSSYRGTACSGLAARMKEGLLPFLVEACSVNWLTTRALPPHFLHGKIHLPLRIGKNTHVRRLFGKPAHILFRIRLFNARQNHQSRTRASRTDAADVHGSLRDALNDQPHCAAPFSLRMVTFVPARVSMASSLQSCRLK